ncbi:hypothetical protein [Nocardia australiensis]|uniref:hypothetical protein n=1 Tax=Nocardia australiensis TaxID=2887191 RepID=UPI001D154AEE|nr:hypothetical protein [Nocardia australiensis]
MLALLCFCWCGIPRLLRREVLIPEQIPAKEIVRRVVDECHPAPAIPFTPERAHREMQLLIDCDTDQCARKREAFWTVVDAGHGTPRGGSVAGRGR